MEAEWTRSFHTWELTDRAQELLRNALEGAKGELVPALLATRGGRQGSENLRPGYWALCIEGHNRKYKF